MKLFIRVEFFESEDIKEILISLKNKRNSYIHDNENYITQHDRNSLKIVLDYIFYDIEIYNKLLRIRFPVIFL